MKVDHVDLGPENTYHQLVVVLGAPDARVRADSLGRLNPRIYFPEWIKVRCNNGGCPAWGIVHDSVLVDALEDGASQ